LLFTVGWRKTERNPRHSSKFFQSLKAITQKICIYIYKRLLTVVDIFCVVILCVVIIVIVILIFVLLSSACGAKYTTVIVDKHGSFGHLGVAILAFETTFNVIFSP